MSQTKLTTLRSVIEAAGRMREVARGARCACGCGGSWSRYVSGTSGDTPAIWMGCSRRGGSTVGGGLTGTDCRAAHAVLAACDRLGLDVDDVIDTTIEYQPGRGMVAAGPLAEDYQRECLVDLLRRRAAGDLTALASHSEESVRAACERLGVDAADALS